MKKLVSGLLHIMWIFCKKGCFIKTIGFGMHAYSVLNINKIKIPKKLIFTIDGLVDLLLSPILVCFMYF